MSTQDQQAQKQKLNCTFCGKDQHEVSKLIAGPAVFICNECVELCQDVLDQEGASAARAAVEGIPSPQAIRAHLDDYIIGQDRPKKIMSVAVHNHYKRLAHAPKDKDDVELSKSNVLLVGPTGSGKTLFAQTLARMLDVPFAMADATSLSEAGYVGEDVEAIVQKLLQAADYDVQRAQRGIVYVDEIDKVSRRGDSASITRDVSGEGVQQALLKIMEGTVCNVAPQGGRKNPQQETIAVDTSNILFVCGGAFDGLDKVVKARGKTSSIGFGADVEGDDERKPGEVFEELEPEDLIRFGLIPEFVGRVPVVATLHDLDEDALVSILKEPKNALLKQYQRMFGLEDVKLRFTDDGLRAVAQKAIARNAGARGLRAIMEDVLLDTMFQIPGEDDVSEVHVGRDVVQGESSPKLVRESGKAA